MRWQLLKDSFALTLRHFGLIILNGLPVAILNAVFQYYAVAMTSTGEFSLNFLDGIRLTVLFVLLAIIATSYYVYMIKIGLFGIDSVPQGFALRFGRTERRLLGYSVLLFTMLGLVLIVVAVLFSVVGGLLGDGENGAPGWLGFVAGILALAVFVWGYPRLFLFWPIIISDDPHPFSTMFALCRDRTWFIWSVVLLVILLMIPIGIVLGILGAVSSMFLPDLTAGVPFFIQQLVAQLVTLPLGAWFSFVIAGLYLHLKANSQSTPPIEGALE